MNAKLKRNLVFLTMTATSGLIMPMVAAEARKPQDVQPQAVPAAAGQREAQLQAQAQAAAGQREAQLQARATQAQEREAQVQALRAQQEQAKQQQEIELTKAAEARRQQERTLIQQEQQARRAQLDALKSQQEQALKMQQQQQQQVRVEERQSIEHLQEANIKAAQVKLQQEKSRVQQLEGQQQQRAAMIEHGPGSQPGSQFGRGTFATDRRGNPVFTRPAAPPPPLTVARIPLPKALAMPILAPDARPEDRVHLEEVQHNLQAHLIAVAAADAPSNFHDMGRFAREAYFNNYQATIANQQLVINRQNTYINALEQNQWPAWYQPEPNYQFANSFTLGDSVVSDLNWLRWGWHPYYGPQPEGFVAARNYVPTPWIYIPAYGTWRQPGVNEYSAYGPPYDYTGPISVEVFEPREMNVNIPFGGWLPKRVVNVIYFYNAYYFPEYERYGYMNRHGNWIWLNFDESPL